MFLAWQVFFEPLCFAACPPKFPPKPGGLIENRWNKLGGCNPAANNPLGDPIGPEIRNPYTGGLSQDFEQGQIVVYDRWAGGVAGQMAQFVMLAYVKNAQVHVEWGDTSPFSYDLFNVRWDFDGLPDDIAEQHNGGLFSKDPQQDSVGGGTGGSFDFKVDKTGVLRIVVEGCDKGFFSSTCRQGFSHPVTIDVTASDPNAQLVMHEPLSLTSAPTPPQPPKTTPLSDNVGDAPELDSATANQVIESICDASDLIETDGDHKGELNVNAAIAVLSKTHDMTIKCRNLPDPSYDTDPIRLRVWVNQKIRDATVVSEPGTDAAFVQGLVGAAVGASIAALVIALGTYLASVFWAVYSPVLTAIAAAIGIAVSAVIGFITCNKHGDYDMRLTRLVQISYLFDDVLEQSTKDHIRNDLLTVKGPASKRREHVYLCGIPTIIPESENHILMTEASRYLTNQLIAEDAIRRGAAVPGDNDNEANGMNDWFLGHLQEFMQNDFYEYNARPYTFQARLGIQNLFDYAAYPGTTCWRFTSGTPMPPPPRACDVKRGARIVLDYLAAKFAVSSNGLRRVAPFRRQPERKDYPYLFGKASDEALFSYLAFVNGSNIFWTRMHRFPPAGAGENLLQAYIGAFRPSPVITDLVSDANGYPFSFHRFYFNRDTHYAAEVYYRTPDYLLSAGGLYDAGRLSFLSSKEDAWAMATTLMPTRGGLDRREFVSILGSSEDDERVNTCVGPSFACGQNPWIPPGVPQSCQLTSGNWTFLDFDAQSPGCDINYGFFVVVYSAPCRHVTCDDRFGFFEVTPWQSGGGLEDLAKKIQAANPDAFHEDSKNIYVNAFGRAYYFIPSRPRDKTPPLTGELWEQWGMLGTREPGQPMNSFDTTVRNWALADGEYVHSDKHTGCVIVDNPGMDQRLVLDFSDRNHPKRTRIWRKGDECGCPMPDWCRPSHYQ